MKPMLGMKWQKQIATSIKVGTILRKVSKRHSVREVIIEKGKLIPRHPLVLSRKS